ncbi:hypothetical protein NP493_172g02042 [Ridgeia piscesae]|uniref:Anaphase-promoting complex subunit CDC26 n=1 Tax=Ridgeia piscesae TaxID=27915 RepID=A0AAD9P3A2_RIDPI|nr:hypothetical protein NP493_172g02042 [Ridgeia piscesae]
MLRRKPTRIELKLDDFEEWSNLRKEKQEAANASQTAQAGQCTPVDSETAQRQKRDMIHERIGYDPKPLPQPSRLPIH